MLAAGCALSMLLAACGGPADRAGDSARQPTRLQVDVRADSGLGRLRVDVPRVRVWVDRVSVVRPGSLEVPLPDAAPDPIPAAPPASRLSVDPGLKPPILRSPAALVLPPSVEPPAGAVELEVHVDASGGVTDAVWAGGVSDTAWVNAARRCALRMTFFPAVREGRPVAVWCLQRFELARP